MTFFCFFAVSLEVQSKDVMDKTPKMKLKDNTVSSAATTKSSTVKTTTATTSKTDSKWLAASNVSATTSSDKLKPLVTHELSVVSPIFILYFHLQHILHIINLHSPFISHYLSTLFFIYNPIVLDPWY